MDILIGLCERDFVEQIHGFVQILYESNSGEKRRPCAKIYLPELNNRINLKGIYSNFFLMVLQYIDANDYSSCLQNSTICT